MDSAIIQAALGEQRLAYMLADGELRIVECGDAAGVLGAHGLLPAGRSLLDSWPELVGVEPLVADLLSGELPRFQLEYVNRPKADSTTSYFTLTLLPYRGKRQGARLLLLISDTTEQGQAVQLLAQRRNELRLLRDELAQRNLDLTAAIAELRRLDEMKSMFVSIAAHELRNPLTPILGYLELLLDDSSASLSQDQRDTLGILWKHVIRLQTITSDLLDMARIEAGQIELVLRPTDLRALITMVGAEYRSQLAAKKQQLQLDIGASLPEALCDETRATQIVSNLLSNASKYTPPKGQITIRLEQAEEGFLRIAVSDTGIGIAAEDQINMFSAFFRARDPAAAQARGTGLGLHITRLLVELHGGQIWFASQHNAGSTFYVTLPIADDPAELSPARTVELSA